MWDLIQNCLDILGISEDEAMGLWSLLAAIYHLGYAGVKKSELLYTLGLSVHTYIHSLLVQTVHVHV